MSECQSMAIEYPAELAGRSMQLLSSSGQNNAFAQMSQLLQGNRLEPDNIRPAGNLG